jgi:hypothetical protein
VKITHMNYERGDCFDASFDTEATASFFCTACNSLLNKSITYYNRNNSVMFESVRDEDKEKQYTITALLFITKEELNTVLEYCANLGFEIKDGGWATI